MYIRESYDIGTVRQEPPMKEPDECPMVTVSAGITKTPRITVLIDRCDRNDEADKKMIKEIQMAIFKRNRHLDKNERYEFKIIHL